MGFSDRLQSDLGKRYPKPVSPRDGPQPPGRFSFGTQTYGGPTYTDAFNARRGPSQLRLAENYNALIYAMVNRTRDGVTRVPMRLLADGSRAQGKPSRACDPIRVSRAMGKRLAGQGKISSAAVDQVYEIRNHPLLNTVDEPDPYGTFTREKLIGILCMFMDVFGSAFLVPEGNGWDWRKPGKAKGPPECLWVIYPQYTIPVRMAASPIVERFQYFADPIPYEAVVWFRHNHSIKDVYGAAFSPTYAGEPYRQQEQELVAILSQVLGIGPRPNLIMSAKDALAGINPTQMKVLKQDMVSKQAAYAAGGILVTDGSWDVTPVDYPKADIAAKDIAQHDRDNLANIFGMPPTYFTVDSNLANLQAADAQFAKANTEPRCKTIEAQFTRLAKQCDPRLFFAFDPVLGENELEQAQCDKIYVDMGAITINELNEEKKYSKKPWGDAPWMPGTLKQPDMIMEAHDQSLEQGQAAIDGQDLEGGLAIDEHEHKKGMDKKKLEQGKSSPEERALADVLELTRTIRAKINAA